MSTLARPLRSGRRLSPLAAALRVAAIGCGAFYLLVVALAFFNLQDPFGAFKPLALGLLAILPMAAFLSVRYPLVFPFGAYVALIPFDVLLSVTSGVTLTRYVAILTGVALIFRCVLLRRVCSPGRSWTPWLAFVTYAGFSLLWTPDPSTSQLTFGIILQNFVIMSMLAIYPLRPVELRAVFVAIAGTGIATALYALQLYHAGSFGKDDGRFALQTSGGVTLDPNWFSTSFVLPICVCLAALLTRRSIALRALCAAGVVVMMGGILVSGSRGGFLAVVVVFGYFVLRSRRRLQIGAIATAALGLSLLFPAVLERFAKDPGRQGTGSGRTFIWQTGLHTLRDHWLFGSGYGSFQAVYDKSLLAVFQPDFQGWYRPSHNILVGTVTELGVIGVALLGASWVASFRQLRAVAPGSRFYGARLACEATLVGLAVQAFFIDVLLIKYYWLAFSLPLLVHTVARRERGAAEAAAA